MLNYYININKQNKSVKIQVNISIFCKSQVRPTSRLERSGLPTLVFWPSYIRPSLTYYNILPLSLSHRPRHFAWLLTLHVIVITILFTHINFLILPFHSNRLRHIGRHMTRASVVLCPFLSLVICVCVSLSAVSRPLYD